MLIHECTGCGKISINRIAADDNEETILKVFDESQKLPLQKKVELQRKNIAILSSEAKERVITQLFGKIN